MRAAAALAADRRRRAADRLAARLAAARARPAEVARPLEPLAVGDADAARERAGGRLAFAGASVEIGRLSPWAVEPPSPGWSAALHGFGWLDDARVARREDRALARAWVWDWARRYGGGGGPGWRPELAARRLTRMLAAAPMLLEGADPRGARRLMRTLDAHLRFLRARASAAPPGPARAEAAAGLLLGGLCLKGGGVARLAGERLLGRIAETSIDAEGAPPDRDPQRLAELFALLAWAVHALREARLEPDPRLPAALGRAGPILRALRLPDGGLARLHGGGAEPAAPLDQAFALAGADARGGRRDQPMGMLRLAAGGAVALLDAAPPPAAAPQACASTLGLEFAAGGRRLVSSVGPAAALAGTPAAEAWSLAARATAAASTLEIAGASSSSLAPAGLGARRLGRPLVRRPSPIKAERAQDEAGQWAMAEHDGYLSRFGLMHLRRLNLSADGRALGGEDALACPDAAARARFDQAQRDGALPFVVRFHLHPEIVVATEAEGARLSSPDGAVWTFRAAGGELLVQESAWIDEADRAARPSRQLAIFSRAEAYWGRVTWRFARLAPPRRGGGDGDGDGEGVG